MRRGLVLISVVGFALVSVTGCQTAAVTMTAGPTPTEKATSAPPLEVDTTPAEPRSSRSTDKPSFTPLPPYPDTTEASFGPPVNRQGDFQLALTSNSTEYAAGEPISVSAEFTYV